MTTIRYRYPRTHHRHAVLPDVQTVTVRPERAGMMRAALWSRGVVLVEPQPAREPVQARLFGGGR